MSLKQDDFYYENGKMVFTENYHLKRGECCGQKCRHCAFWPKYQKGNTNIKSHLSVIQKTGN